MQCYYLEFSYLLDVINLAFRGRGFRWCAMQNSRNKSKINIRLSFSEQGTKPLKNKYIFHRGPKYFSKVSCLSQAYRSSPHWWRFTTQVWAVLLIGWSKFSTNQKHYPDLGSDTSSVWNFCARFSDVTSWGNRLVASRNAAVFSGYGQLYCTLTASWFSTTLWEAIASKVSYVKRFFNNLIHWNSTISHSFAMLDNKIYHEKYEKLW